MFPKFSPAAVASTSSEVEGLLAPPRSLPNFYLLALNWLLMHCLTHTVKAHTHMEGLKQCLLVHTLRRKLHCSCTFLSAKLVLSFPVMPMCKPVVWASQRRSCLPPPVGEMEGGKVMCDHILGMWVNKLWLILVLLFGVSGHVIAQRTLWMIICVSGYLSYVL